HPTHTEHDQRQKQVQPRIRRDMWLRGHNEGPAPAGPSPYSPALPLGQVLDRQCPTARTPCRGFSVATAGRIPVPAPGWLRATGVRIPVSAPGWLRGTDGRTPTSSLG